MTNSKPEVNGKVAPESPLGDAAVQSTFEDVPSPRPSQASAPKDTDPLGTGTHGWDTHASVVEESHDATAPSPEGETSASPPTEEVVQLSRGEYEQLLQSIEKSRSTVDEMKDLAMRKAADMENLRRRTQKQIDDQQRFGLEKVLKEFLPVVDDLERGIVHARNSTAKDVSAEEKPPVETFIDGMLLVLKKFYNTLERFGVRGFTSVGQPFNPQLHEAISQIESPEHADGTVAIEYLRGYLLHDRLMRPAVVVVAKNPTGAQPDEAPTTPDTPPSGESPPEATS